MIKEKYRTNEICQFDYSDILEKSFDENYTDKPLRNDEVVALLNEQEEKIKKLEKENQGLQFIKEQGSVTREEIKQLQKQHQVIEEQYSRIEELRWSNKVLRANRKSCEQARIRDRKNWESMDKMRVEHIRFLQKRLKENGLSSYIND